MVLPLQILAHSLSLGLLFFFFFLFFSFLSFQFCFGYLCCCFLLLLFCARKFPHWLRLCPNTSIPARTPRPHLPCRVMWELASLIHDKSLHNSIRPPEMENNPPKTACSCPRRGVITSHTPSLQNLWNAVINVQVHNVPGDAWSVQLGNATTDNTAAAAPPPPSPPATTAAAAATATTTKR